MSQKYRQIWEMTEQLTSVPEVLNKEQDGSITIRNSKTLKKANYLLAEIRKTQTIPSGTTGF